MPMMFEPTCYVCHLHGKQSYSKAASPWMQRDLPVSVQRTWKRQKVQQPSPPPAPELSCCGCGSGPTETLGHARMMAHLQTNASMYTAWNSYRRNVCHPVKLLITLIFKSELKLLADQHRCTGESSPDWQEEEWWQSGWEGRPHLMTFCSTQWKTVRRQLHEFFSFECVSVNKHLLHKSKYCPVAVVLLLFRGGHLR